MPLIDSEVLPRKHLPAWLKRPVIVGGKKSGVEAAIGQGRLHTVCAEAKCPNRGECFSSGTATFLILGDVCTRTCGFCAIGKGTPLSVDKEEPGRVARAVGAMRLRHAVITSVTRDDLPDGGAGHFAETVALVHERNPGVTVEVLVPDFSGDPALLETVLESRPDVLNHNVETVPRLYRTVRPRAVYERSIALLRAAAAGRNPAGVKSGLMVGLGEFPDEVLAVLRDLHEAGCSIVTIGQYLQPGPGQLPVEAFIEPAQFEAYAKAGREIGLKQIFAGPFVRSSYHAAELYNGATGRI
jgi:lipoyl synthase